MYRRLWIALNLSLVVSSFVYIWFFRPHDSYTIILGQIMAQMAILLFIINVNMFFVFLVIRKTPQRKVKISLVKFSRWMMKGHIKIAVSGAILIVIHAWIMMNQFKSILGYGHMKLLSGYLSICFLTVTLITGFLRHKKSSGYRRKFHLGSAMTFTVVFFFHLFF